MAEPGKPGKPRRRGSGGRGRRLPHVLWRDQWDGLIKAAGKERLQKLLAARDEAIVALGLFSGLRAGEIVALNVEDLDLKRGMAHVRHGKGDKERWAAVGRAALKKIEAYLDMLPDPQPEDPLFRSRKGGGRLCGTTAWRVVNAASQRAGHGDKVHTHTLRHSHGTRMREVGADLFAIAEQLGHEDLDTTRIYMHLAATERQKLADKL